MKGENQTVEEYYESLKIKYSDINQKIESLLQSESSETLVKFEMIFEYPTHEDALRLPQKLYHPADDNEDLIYPYEESGKFYSGFSNKKQPLDGFQIITGYHAYLTIALESNGKLSNFKLTKT